MLKDEVAHLLIIKLRINATFAFIIPNKVVLETDDIHMEDAETIMKKMVEDVVEIHMLVLLRYKTGVEAKGSGSTSNFRDETGFLGQGSLMAMESIIHTTKLRSCRSELFLRGTRRMRRYMRVY